MIENNELEVIGFGSNRHYAMNLESLKKERDIFPN